MTRYIETDSDGTINHGIELISTSTASAWYTVERNNMARATGGGTTAFLEVGDDFDTVMAWALSDADARQYVLPPAGGDALWETEGAGGSEFEIKTFNPTPGRWTLGGNSLGGDMYMQLHAVRWGQGSF